MEEITTTSVNQEAPIPLRNDAAKHFILLSLENSRSKRGGSYRVGNGPRQTFNRPSVFYWDHLSDDLKQDRDIALAAFAYCHVKVADLPSQFNQDFLEAVQKNSGCWYKLSAVHKRDPEFVRSFKSFSSNSLVAAVFEAHPSLQNDTDVWGAIISSKTFFRSLEDAPFVIRSNREFMLEACVEKVKNLRYVSDGLASDKNFLQDVIDMDPDALRFVSHDAQIQFPELVIDNLERFLALKSNRYGGTLLGYIAPDMLTNSAFIEKWFTLGGDFSTGQFPDSFQDNEQIFLWVVRHGPKYSFSLASDRLRRDSEFVKQLIEIQPCAYFCASHDVQADAAVVIKALATGSGAFAKDYVKRVHNTEHGEELLETFCTFLQLQLDWNETFMTSILLGISLQADASQRPLSVLNQGTETSLVYKKLIAQYAGVPIQKRLLSYRRAHLNLTVAKHEFETGGTDEEPTEANEQNPAFGVDLTEADIY